MEKPDLLSLSNGRNCSKADNLDYCLRNLIAVDITPFTDPSSLLSLSRENVQLLVNRIFSLPTTPSEDGLLVSLEHLEPTIRLPRQKHIPQPKPKTRWQKFAETKGITKRKRGRKVWDDVAQDWTPRWGYKSVKKNREKAEAVIEVKPGQDPYEDPFEKKSTQKQIHKAKQKLRELRNVSEAKGTRLPAGIPNLDVDSNSRKVGKANLKEIMKRAKISSASYGRHDKIARGEDPRKKAKPSQKVTSRPLREEQEFYLKTLSQMERRRELDVKLKNKEEGRR